MIVKDDKSITVQFYNEHSTKLVWEFVKVVHDLVAYFLNFKENELLLGPTSGTTQNSERWKIKITYRESEEEEKHSIRRR